MKKYRSNVEGLLMHSPAVFLHKDQLMQVEQDTVETVLALQQGKISYVSGSVEVATGSTDRPQAEAAETTTAATEPAETHAELEVKPTKRKR